MAKLSPPYKHQAIVKHQYMRVGNGGGKQTYAEVFAGFRVGNGDHIPCVFRSALLTGIHAARLAQRQRVVQRLIGFKLVPP